MNIIKFVNQQDIQAIMTKKLREAADAYYQGKSEISDHEYDRLFDELVILEKKSGFAYDISPTIMVGSKVTELLKVKHEEPALSLDKVKYAEKEKLVKWLGNHDAVISWKMDGLTVVVTYDNGKLVRAVTRGDGFEGSDIMHNARYFHGLPSVIPYKGHVVIRGEAVMSYEEFEKVNKDAGGIYENPRNLAAATIQMLDSEESRKRKISYFAFKLVSPNVDKIQNECDRLNWIGEQGIQVVPFDCSIDDNGIIDEVESWKKEINEFKFPTDGLVISYENAKYAESLGSTGHHPRGSIALKWTDETVTTTLRDIEWSVGKTGVITPVAIFDEVRLGAGSNVARASLHNLSIMEKMPVAGQENYEPIEIGSKIEVYLANMIIPQIASIRNGKETKRIEIPDRCPACGKPTRIDISESGIKSLICENPECSARVVGLLMNTFSKDGLFIKGLGESQIRDLLKAELVDSNPISFYWLKERTERKESDYYKKKKMLLMTDGWGAKSWKNLIDAIDASRKTTLQKFLYSLNIPLLGNDLSKKLSKMFDGDPKKFLEFVKNPSLAVLLNQDGVGDEKANNIYKWCLEINGNTRKFSFLEGMILDELEFEGAVNTAEQNLNGKTIVITGAVHQYKNRDEFKKSVEARGGKVASSVSRNTDYLVNNDAASTSSKNNKAKELGIPIITEDEFIKKFGK